MSIENANMTSYLMTIVMFIKSFTIYEIFANEIKGNSLTLKIEVKVIAENMFKMDLHVPLPVLPNILTSPQCSSSFIGSKLNNGFNIRSSPLHTTSSI